MSEKKKVLIICGTAVGQMYLGVLLNRIWYAPVLVKTAEEGVHVAQTDSFAVIILDGDIPDAELNAALVLLRGDISVKAVPLVVFITGESSVKHEAFIARGCSAVLTKPLDLAFVYTILARLSGQRRNTPRVPARMRVEIKEGTPDKSLMCINISEGGVYLRTHEPLPEGTALRLKFTLPRDVESLELEAEVVRTSPLGIQIETEPGMGLRFRGIPEEVQKRIRNFVQWELIGDLEWEATI
jgi:uncharacterized protein (TIGR02266 family)